MKQFHLLALLLLVFSTLETNAQARAKKYPLFEHFTQTNCGPCAQQNPIFQENILNNNFGNIHHIAYHANFPSPNNDPMHLFNPTEILARQDYYSIGGVPTMIADGEDIGSPVNASQDWIDNTALDESVLEILVSETTQDNTRNVTVNIKSMDTWSAEGNWKLRVAVVEKEINYTSAPGSNGEKYFPNVFRQFLTVEDFTAAALGNTNTYNFSYDLDETWVPENIYVVAFVQNEDSKYIENSGASNDPSWYLRISDNAFKKGEPGSTTSFLGQIVNNGPAGDYELSLESATNDWVGYFIIDGQNYNPNQANTISLAANSTTPVFINVIPNDNSGIYNFRLKMRSPQEDYAYNNALVTLISNVHDLVVNNAESGEGSTDTNIFDGTYYTNGLIAAGNTHYGATAIATFSNAYKAGILDDVYNIYLNIGWTFPAFTDEEVVILGQFLDNGGNLLVAGQDVAWDTFDTASGAANGTQNTREFVYNYLGVDFVDDGGSTNASIHSISTDPIFGNVGSSDIFAAFTSSYYYPDVIKLADGISTASAIFDYNDNSSLVCGIRNESANYKTVYIAIGMEMVENESVRNDIITKAHNWFYDGVEIIGFENLNNEQAVGIYPNPAQNKLSLVTNNISGKVLVQLNDLSGRLVKSYIVDATSGNTSISLDEVTNGAYLCQIFSESALLSSQKLVILK
ncbi:MAG: Omp28-related outer membrane protein [Chitinophagales bacterium]|nr:Omp28-related outer membrane protein [Bacteroidota bacterium]MCB9044253.1 Omp28-related outer membrane protein [Chitinophagales bacterium]